MPGRYPQQSIEMQDLTQEALWDILVRHGLDGVQPMPHLCKDKGAVYTFIESLTDDTEYVGVPAPPALTLNVRVRSVLSPVSLVATLMTCLVSYVWKVL